MLAAADTFRAAAIEQLETWAQRARLPIVAHHAGRRCRRPLSTTRWTPPLRAAATSSSSIPQAGCIPRRNLMEELAKIRRTIGKRLPDAQPEVVFVLDATTGQNGLAQAKAFHESAGLTGIVLTKLDTTSRGGIAFAIEDALGVPVLFVGVGEELDDLLDFDPNAFVERPVRLDGVLDRPQPGDRREPYQDGREDRADGREEDRRPQADHQGQRSAAQGEHQLRDMDRHVERGRDPPEFTVVDDRLLQRDLRDVKDGDGGVAEQLLGDQEACSDERRTRGRKRQKHVADGHHEQRQDHRPAKPEAARDTAPTRAPRTASRCRRSRR